MNWGAPFIFFCRIIFIPVSLCTCLQASKEERGVRCPGSAVTGSFKLLNMGARIRTQVF